jgi:hypothetical protein
MAINLATKYSPKVAERFSRDSLTKVATNQDYEWQGVNAVNVYSVDTVTMGDYTRNGANRYGNPAELGTTKQTLTLSRDRAFTTTIDRRNNDESMGVTEAGKFLSRQIREVIVPEVDTYVLAALGTAAAANGKDNVTTDGAVTVSNAYSNFLLLQDSLTNDLVPLTDRVAFMTSSYYSLFKQGGFVLDSDRGQGKLESGELGMIDNVKPVVVPSSWMPSNTALVLTHKSVCVAPMVLTDYIIHENAPGINGWLVEGRVVYDAFVLTAKIDGVAVHKTS